MEAIQELTEINYTALFVSIFAALAGIKVVCGLLEWVIVSLGLETKWMRRKREDHDLLVRTSKRVDDLEKKQEHDVNESIRHDKLIKEDLSKVVDTLSTINEKLDAMERKHDEPDRAKLKDRTAQAYRKHHETGKWTRMDKEAYEGLIRDYESHNGKNSFVHDICEPESFTWEIID